MKMRPGKIITWSFCCFWIKKCKVTLQHVLFHSIYWHSNWLYLGFVHPWNVDTLLSLWAFESVRWVDRNMVHNVVQSHVAWFLVVMLTNEDEGFVLHSARWCFHVEEFSALWRQHFFHSSSNRWCYHVDKKENCLHPKCHNQLDFGVTPVRCKSFKGRVGFLS